MILYVTYEEYGYGDEYTKNTIYVGADLNTAKSFSSTNTLLMEMWVEGSLVRREATDNKGYWRMTYDRIVGLTNDIKETELKLANKKAELEKIIKGMEREES